MANLTLDSSRIGCTSGHSDGEGRYICDVSGDQCLFLIPSSKACAEIFGEGPDAWPDDEEK